MSKVNPARNPTEHRRHPTLGIVPTTTRGRVFCGWALANVVLALLPVWDLAFNDGQVAGGFLPVTILWSYLVFTSNFVLAIALFVVWARKWASAVDDTPDDARPQPTTATEEGS